MHWLVKSAVDDVGLKVCAVLLGASARLEVWGSFSIIYGCVIVFFCSTSALTGRKHFASQPRITKVCEQEANVRTLQPNVVIFAVTCERGNRFLLLNGTPAFTTALSACTGAITQL